MNAEVIQFKRLLEKNCHYITKPRLRLFAILQRHPALTIQELIAYLPKHDQATVYRNIKVFEKLGVIARLQLGWSSKLELSDSFRHHHHHMTCVQCSKVFVLPDDDFLERQITKLTSSQNFKQTDHQLEIRGICQECGGSR